MSLYKRKIDITISLGTGDFGEGRGPDVTLTGLRVQASISVPGGDAMASAQVRVFGLPLNIIQQLTTVGPLNPQLALQNTLLLSAGTEEEGMTTVYSGTISQAWGDFQSTPEVSLNVIGLGGLAALVKPVGPRSYPGPTDVALICQDIAKSMGVSFENNGVSVMLSSPYLPGTDLMQLRSCAQAANISYAIDRGTLAIWPKLGGRGGDTPLISKATGLVGYPSFTSQGLGLVTLFNPELKVGGFVRVESTLSVATGRWFVPAVSHSLESEVPNGQWFTQIIGYPPHDQ